MGCAIYYLFTSDIKNKLNLKNDMYRDYIDDSLPYVINKSKFGLQELNGRTDELIFGIFSIYEMGEFVSSKLTTVKNSMRNFIEIIADKVNLNFSNISLSLYYKYS